MNWLEWPATFNEADIKGGEVQDTYAWPFPSRYTYGEDEPVDGPGLVLWFDKMRQILCLQV